MLVVFVDRLTTSVDRLATLVLEMANVLKLLCSLWTFWDGKNIVKVRRVQTKSSPEFKYHEVTWTWSSFFSDFFFQAFDFLAFSFHAFDFQANGFSIFVFRLMNSVFCYQANDTNPKTRNIMLAYLSHNMIISRTVIICFINS